MKTPKTLRIYTKRTVFLEIIHEIGTQKPLYFYSGYNC